MPATMPAWPGITGVPLAGCESSEISATARIATPATQATPIARSGPNPAPGDGRPETRGRVTGSVRRFLVMARDGTRSGRSRPRLEGSVRLRVVLGRGVLGRLGRLLL